MADFISRRAVDAVGNSAHSPLFLPDSHPYMTMNATSDFSIPNPAVIKRRDPKIARQLSKCCPGLGHIYSGSIRRGLAFLAAVDLLFVLGVILLLAPWGSMWGACGVFIISVGIAIYSVFDSSKVVLGTRPDYRMKDYNHWFAYAVISVVPTLAIAIAVSSAITKVTQLTKAVSPIPMIDIRTGDYFIEWKTAYRANKPAVGDYITYRGHLGDSRIYMGKIIALPGARDASLKEHDAVPEGHLLLERTNFNDDAQPLISEMAVVGKLVHRLGPLRRGNQSL